MEKTIISFQIDKETLATVDEKATSEGRNRSSWIRAVLSRALESAGVLDTSPDIGVDTGTAG